MDRQKYTDNLSDKSLPDIVEYGLKVLFVGYNPGIQSAIEGHHYANKSNRFWKLLYDAGITPYKFSPEDDAKLLELGFGSTNIVARPSKSSADISSGEFRAGAEVLARLIIKIKPAIVCYVGYGVYRAFCSYILKISPGKVNITKGIQKVSLIDGVSDFVCSNPSGLNTIPYYEQLECFRELRRLTQIK